VTSGGHVALVASTSPGHKARGIRTGMKAERAKAVSKAFGRDVRIKRVRGRALVYGVRRGRVRSVAVATRAAARSRGALRRYLRLAGATANAYKKHSPSPR
jgi:hypothetical protein